MNTGKNGKSSSNYTLEEDDRLLQLIFMSKTASFLRGNAVWQDYANTNRFPNRTWQSLKERFVKHIAPTILQDVYKTPLWVRKLILVVWNRTAKDSKPANITKNWEELFQLAEDAGIILDSSDDEESDITVSDDCKKVYEEIIKQKMHRYVTFHINKERQIDIELVGARNDDYDDFLTDLQIGSEKDCRYGLYDLEYTNDGPSTSAGASTTHKLFLMLWCPDTATNENKDLYKKSFNALKKCLKDVKDCVQATNIADARLSVVKEKLLLNATTEHPEEVDQIKKEDDSMESVEG